MREKTGAEPLLFGIEKSGQFMTHFDDIDWTEDGGPRSRYQAQTVLIPDAKYTNRNIVYRPEDAKPHGQDTYYGRKVMYKTRAGDHNVLTVAITNDMADDFSNSNPSVFPRLGDVLNIMDHLSTYLYQDGFMPLVSV